MAVKKDLSLKYLGVDCLNPSWSRSPTNRQKSTSSTSTDS